MEFRNGENKHCSIHLPQRSLLIMDQESRYVLYHFIKFNCYFCKKNLITWRYEWSHGITPRSMDIIETTNGLNVFKRLVRTSFTFRSIRRNGYCDCSYKNMCDTQNNIVKNISDDQTALENSAENLEAIHVHKVDL